MSFELPGPITPDFTARLEKTADRWTVKCSGTLDVSDAAARVQPEMLKLHEAIAAEKIAQVRLEVHDVEYMNSSGLKAFMAWFLAASNSKTHRYAIEVVYDPNKSWQQLSFRPMERLAPNTVKLVAGQAVAPKGAQP